MKNLLVFLLFISFTYATAQNVDSKSSKVNFEISNFGVNTVKGSFSGVSGTVDLNGEKPGGRNIDVCLKTATIDTDNKKRDEHLRSADYFDAKKYPEICFQSSQIKKSGDGYVAQGTLTMHGISKVVDIPFTYNDKTIRGQLTVSRLDFKIGEDTNTFMMGEEVEVEIICQVE